MKKFFQPALLAVAVWIGLPVGQSFAGQVLTIEVDESQMLTLPTPPGAIIIGNPSIADVSVQGQQIFIHGRGFGQTNLTILDLQGNQIANFSVIGKHTQESTVAVFKGAVNARYSYACAPLCEAELQTGDNEGHFNTAAAHTSKKFELATGNKTAEAEAPAAPQ